MAPPPQTPTQGRSTHHPPEEGEGDGEEQDQDQPHILRPLVQALALLLRNLREGNVTFSVLHPMAQPQEGDEADGSQSRPPRPGPSSQLTFSGLKHGRALGCWKSLTPAQVGMRR